MYLNDFTSYLEDVCAENKIEYTFDDTHGKLLRILFFYSPHINKPIFQIESQLNGTNFWIYSALEQHKELALKILKELNARFRF